MYPLSVVHVKEDSPESLPRSVSISLIAFGTAHRVSVLVGMIMELRSLPGSLLLHAHTYSTVVAACRATNYTSDNKNEYANKQP